MIRLRIIPLTVLAVTPCATVTAQDFPVVGVVVSSGFVAGVGALFGLYHDADAAGVNITLVPVESDPNPPDPNSPCFRTSCALVGAALGASAGAVLPLAFWAEERGANPILVRGTAGLLLGAVAGAAVGLFAENRDAAAIQLHLFHPS